MIKTVTRSNGTAFFFYREMEFGIILSPTVLASYYSELVKHHHYLNRKNLTREEKMTSVIQTCNG